MAAALLERLEADSILKFMVEEIGRGVQLLDNGTQKVAIVHHLRIEGSLSLRGMKRKTHKDWIST